MRIGEPGVHRERRVQVGNRRVVDGLEHVTRAKAERVSQGAGLDAVQDVAAELAVVDEARARMPAIAPSRPPRSNHQRWRIGGSERMGQACMRG